MPHKFTEAEYENVLIDIFQNELNYNYMYGPDIDRQGHEILLIDILEGSINNIYNKKVPTYNRY